MSNTVSQIKHGLEVKKGRNYNLPAFSASWALCRRAEAKACQEASCVWELSTKRMHLGSLPVDNRNTPWNSEGRESFYADY